MDIDIEKIKAELKPREGLFNETLQRAEAEKRRSLSFGDIAMIAACAAVTLAAVLPAALKAGPAPEKDASAEVTASPAAAVTPVPEPTPEVTIEGEFVEGADIFLLADSASDIFEGVCESISFDEGDPYSNAKMGFTVTRVLRGGLHEGDSVPVRANTGNGFSVGGRYLLLTIPMGSVFDGTELFYQVDSFFSPNGATEWSVLPGAAGLDYEAIVQSIAQYAADTEYSGGMAGLGFWCASDDIGEVLEFSDCAVRVRVRDVELDAISDRTTYSCSVTECYKGDVSGSIRVVSFKHSMETGKEYVLLLTSSDSLYVVCSPHSVLEPDSAEAALAAGK